jgi:membrane-bound ClpP family serine protease
MESYQSIGIVLGIVGIFLGIVGSLAAGWVILVAIVSIIGICVVLVNTKHHKNVGITLMVLGILGNLLLIIPGIMAYRYKPESESQIKPHSKE